MFPATIVAAGGAVFSTPLRAVTGGGVGGWVGHYRVFVGSAVMAAITAFCYASLHFALSQ